MSQSSGLALENARDLGERALVKIIFLSFSQKSL